MARLAKRRKWRELRLEYLTYLGTRGIPHSAAAIAEFYLERRALKA